MSIEFLLLLGITVCVLPILGVALSGGVSNNIAILVSIAVLARLFSSGLNQWVGLFEPKPAGEFALNLYLNVQNGGDLPPITETFLVQMLLAWPFLATDATLESLILANNAWSMILTFWAVSLVKHYLDRRSLLMLLGMALLFPIVLNFGLFGLRDPIVYGFVFLFLAASIRVSVKPVSNVLFVWVLALISLASLRPALCVPLLVFPILQAMALSKRIKPGRGLDAYNVVAQKALVFFFLGFVAVVGALGAYRLGIASIGYDQITAPDEIVEQYVVSRHERQFSGGGSGSAIYQQADFSSLPFPARAVVSFSAMLLIPFPWHITDLSRLLTFLDSLLVLGVLVWCVTGVRRRYAMTPTSRNLLITFLLSTFVIGIFMVNFGNAFRMRYAIIPLLFLAAAFIHHNLQFTNYGRPARRLHGGGRQSGLRDIGVDRV